MRRTTVGILGAVMLVLAGCGSGSTFANRPRPPAPIDLTVYINDARVSVSPDSFGAGPATFIVANGASGAESLQIRSGDGNSEPLADTGPINPQATAQVRVDLTPGDYTVATGSGSQGAGPTIQPAHIHVGPTRGNGSNTLLQP